MKNILLIVIILCSFGSCTACLIEDDKNGKACKPVCYPNTYKYLNADGKCVCDANLVIR